ncbi:Resolvase, N terminal domain [Bacteroides thetaiotaomicron]|nr:Resolvase, N terminal domain [Bacteroides thetaiotaomicron]
MKTAVIYARVSSSNDRQDTSRQIEDLKKYAILQDIEIVNIFQEAYFRCKENRGKTDFRGVFGIL